MMIRRMFVSGKTRLPRLLALSLMLALPIAAACGGTNPQPKLPPAGSAEPDKFLFDRGNEELAKKHWVAAREYFRNVVDRYPQSAIRPDAKLALGDTYLAENTAESRVLAVNEYQEFLNYFPTHRRADYALFKIAYAHYKQMLAPQRDQTETREAIAQFESFLKRFPTSALRADAEKYYRESRDRLSDSEFQVGLFYTRVKWCPGAIDRFDKLLKTDPEYTNRDGVYYYMAECYVLAKQNAIALPWYDRLVKEFTSSEYLERAKKRIAALKGGAPKASRP
jgi:outer membrane protein assembly factor BamD